MSYLFVICEGDATGDREPIQHFTMKDEYGNQLGDGHHIVFVDADYDGEWRLKDLMSDFKAKSPETFKYDVLKERTKFFKGRNYVSECGFTKIKRRTTNDWAQKRTQRRTARRKKGNDPENAE